MWTGFGLVLGFALPSQGFDWEVAPDGGGDAVTIAEAVALASSGDTILLADGLYQGPGNRDVDFLGKSIVIRSASDNSEACVIDVGGAPGDDHRAFLLLNGEGPGAGLRSLTITGGHTSDPNFGGAAVQCGTVTDVFFENVRFVNNYSVGSATRGGAVYVATATALAFTDCYFEGNTASVGGAAWTSTTTQSTTTFTRCRFVSNQASSGAAVYSLQLRPGSTTTLSACDFEENLSSGGNSIGAVVLDSNGDVRVDGCRFLRNQGDSGAGLYIRPSTYLSGFPVVISASEFDGNLGTLEGGGLYVSSGGSHPVTVTGCRFLRNAATEGGGIFVTGTHPMTIDQCHFEGNTADRYGGGVECKTTFRMPVIRASSFLSNVAILRAGAVDLEFGSIDACTFATNHAPSGSAVYFGATAGSTVQASIFALNLFQWAVNGITPPTVSCSDFFGNQYSDFIFGVDGGGNFSADPLFCDLGSGDLRLQPGSPCEAGNTGGCGLVGMPGAPCSPVSLRQRSWGSVKASYHR